MNRAIFSNNKYYMHCTHVLSNTCNTEHKRAILCTNSFLQPEAIKEINKSNKTYSYR